MKKLFITIFFFFCIELVVFAQEFDSIPLRSVFVNDFCLGDSVSRLFELFGQPLRIDSNIIDMASERSQPNKNIYYYGKNTYFTEAYLVSKSRIGEINLQKGDSVNMELKILMDRGSILSFKINDSLDVEKLEKYFHASLLFSKKNIPDTTNAYITIKLKNQSDYFEYPYPFINSLTLLYENNHLRNIYTDYFIE